MALKLITPPAAEPVSLAEAKLHLRVVHDSDDALISSLIVAARQRVESETRRVLIEQQWRLSLDAFPCGYVRVPLPPLASVTAVKYIDEAGTLQTLSGAAYAVDVDSEPGRIRAVDSWPATKCDAMNAAQVEFTAGYGNAAAVPAAIKAAILLYVGDMFENREAVLIGTILASNPTVDALLRNYVVFGP